ncbi:RHS repeat protein [Vibrio sp. CyArs1]|uniref:RHS repeat protein n=1 Tax=Vibrio sp. CyArs1 TaxID=2682577 RepID=UPI001F06F575|nr:RHS repeat protein [Vibrio sp. CyArs1]
MAITSNAYSFSEYLQTGVDPRTGSYSCSFHLGEFLSHKTSGPAFSLQLTHQASNPLDFGFGRGWSLSLSRFNPDTSELFLSTGQSFKIVWDYYANEYTVPYRRLKDIRVFYLNASNEIKVVYKDGRQDYIDFDTGTLTKLVSPQGLDIRFEYSNFNNTSVLWRIYDADGREVIIDWWSDKWETCVKHCYDGQELSQIRMVKQALGSSVRLTAVHLPEHSTPIEIAYRYINECGYDVIEQVVHSTGLLEQMHYQDNGHSLPNQAPLPKVPYITEHRSIAGQNQPDRVVTYSYSDKNYLGFASDRAWIAGEDTLFKARRDYQYSSTETINGSQSVVRIYNKYHLLERAEYRQDNTLYKQEDNDYFANLEVGIESQPAVYCFVQEQRVTYYQEGQQNTFTTRYNYDDYGNQTYVRQPDGSEVIRTFYPASGEGSACPAEPNGLVSLLKRESFIPASQELGETPRHVDMTYLSLPRLSNSNEYFVLLSTQAYHDHSVVMTYYMDKTNGYEYGRLATQSTTVNGQISRVSLYYDFAADTLSITQQFIAHDGLSASTSSLMRYWDGQITKSIDAEGIEILSVYDDIGRKLSDTIAPNTPYEATLRWGYTVGSDMNELITTDANGNHQIQHFNNAGKTIKVEQSDASGLMKTIRELSYNDFGLLVTQVDNDWVDGDLLSLTTTYEYDVNGQVSKVTHPDGRVELITQNLATLTTTHEQPGLSKEITVYHDTGLEASKETLDSFNQRLAYTQYHYDGYSNLIHTTDTNQRVTTQSYDSSDRVITTNRTINGQAVSRSVEYADFTTDALETEIAVNNVHLGQREYDGLSRLTQNEASGVKNSISYTGSSRMPSAQITPKGDRLQFSNNKYHQVPMSIDVVGQSEFAQVFTYDEMTGELTSALNQSSQQNFSYNRLGQLISESVQLNDGTQRHATYHYSLQGRLLAKTDFFGNNTTYSYDEHGRLHTVTSLESDQTTTTTLVYDSYSRPIRYDTRNGDDIVSLSLSLNAVGLETHRLVTINNVEEFNLTQNFDSDLQIIEKVYNEKGQLTTERMTYDDLHRLVSYTCDGPNSPKDEYDNTLQSQHFSYDVYGNIVRVESDFTDGTSNRATCTYAVDNPIQLQSLANTHSSYPEKIDFQYDAAGNLLSDEQGRTYQYNTLSQMEAVIEGETELSRYNYDAMGRVVSQTHEERFIYLYYQGNQLANELSEGVHSSYQRVMGAAGSRTLQSSNSTQHQFLISNAQGSILSTLNTSKATGSPVMIKRQYTPYGEG